MTMMSLILTQRVILKILTEKLMLTIASRPTKQVLPLNGRHYKIPKKRINFQSFPSKDQPTLQALWEINPPRETEARETEAGASPKMPTNTADVYRVTMKELLYTNGKRSLRLNLMDPRMNPDY